MDQFIDRTICVAYITGRKGVYGYVPSLAAGVVFCVLFGLSALHHTFVSFRHGTWWQLVFAIGALTETLGWAGRAWSNSCPYQTSPYLLQICTLILAPTFFTAGIYVILGRLIHLFGRQVSPLSAAAYLYIFCTIDVISLVVQAVGGGSAAIAYQKDPPEDTANGTHIMVAGIVFQLASILVFVCLFVLVIMRALKSRGEILAQKKIRWLIVGTVCSVALIVARSVYRTIELLEGWSGVLINTQIYFVILDGLMMLLAVGIFNFIRPGWAEAEGGKPDVEAEQLPDMTEGAESNKS